MADIVERVTHVIADHLGIDVKAVVPDASLVDDLGADSLDTVELVIAFEAAFQIEIPQIVVEDIRTVRDAIEYIEARVEFG